MGTLSRTPRAVLAAATAGLLAIAACSEPLPLRPGRPKNVLLLVGDALRADRLGCYGYPRETSPHIDRVAAEGALYRTNYSQACWTVPSMISMMTGLSVTKQETVLPPDFLVLAEALQKQGVETVAFVANGTLKDGRDFHRGFDLWQPMPKTDAQDVAEGFREWYEERRARALAGEEERGFFAWVHMVETRRRVALKPEYDVFAEPRPEEERLRERWRAELPSVRELAPGAPAPPFEQSLEEMEVVSNTYDGEVRQMDDGMGRVLDALRASGELDDTLVIVCADHGEMLHEHTQQPLLVQQHIRKEGALTGGVRDLFGEGHRPWYFEELWNTPMVLRGPGIPIGAELGGLAANLDIFPTILEALDLPPIPWLEGESLWGGFEPERERVFAYGHRTVAVREASGAKLIVHPRDMYLLEGEGEKPAQLFDVRRDPVEDTDLVDERPKEVARLRAELERWQEEHSREVLTGHTDEALRMLVQMGYADDLGLDVETIDATEDDGDE